LPLATATCDCSDQAHRAAAICGNAFATRTKIDKYRARFRDAPSWTVHRPAQLCQDFVSRADTRVVVRCNFLGSILDQNCFRQLALAELPAVYRLAHHLSHCPHEVEDLVQETYLHALKAAGTFELRECGMRPWLFKILHNVMHARLGQRERDAKLRDELKHHNGGHDPAPPERVEGGDGRIAWENIDQRLKRAIDSLPLQQKTVFLLWAAEGLRYRQIAEIVDAPVGTVMSRLHRARNTLANDLKEFSHHRHNQTKNSGDQEMKPAPK
jgi:RNA polymerase sigma-70 factor, ECF subfamily